MSGLTPTKVDERTGMPLYSPLGSDAAPATPPRAAPSPQSLNVQPDQTQIAAAIAAGAAGAFDATNRLPAANVELVAGVAGRTADAAPRETVMSATAFACCGQAAWAVVMVVLLICGTVLVAQRQYCAAPRPAPVSRGRTHLDAFAFADEDANRLLTKLELTRFEKRYYAGRIPEPRRNRCFVRHSVEEAGERGVPKESIVSFVKCVDDAA